MAFVWEVQKPYLPAKLRKRWPSAMQRISFMAEWLLTQCQIRILSGLLHVEEPRKHNRISFGGHATVVVDSDVERNAVWQ
ncbi:hypothetical protein BH23ACT11_BH23ACT11_27820 [soil metagenome]